MAELIGNFSLGDPSTALLKRHTIGCSNYSSEQRRTGASLPITILYREKIEREKENKTKTRRPKHNYRGG